MKTGKPDMTEMWAFRPLLRHNWVRQRERTVIERQVGHLTRLVDDLLDVHPLGLGLLLGLLPCGLLYSALIAAVSRGGPLEGALALLVFGLGTAPALLGLSLADDLLARRRALLDRLARLFLLAMGAWFVWTGLRG